ncbi:MAG: 50S ribosomal protein L29 [Patescibacteria group bacterium]
MTNMQDIRKKSDKELAEMVSEARKDVRQERFKDRFSRKAGAIRQAKQTIARVLGELSARRHNPDTK